MGDRGGGKEGAEERRFSRCCEAKTPDLVLMIRGRSTDRLDTNKNKRNIMMKSIF